MWMNAEVVRRAEKYVYGMSDRHLEYIQAHMGEDRIPVVAAQKHPRAERRRRKRMFKVYWPKDRVERALS